MWRRPWRVWCRPWRPGPSATIRLKNGEIFAGEPAQRPANQWPQELALNLTDRVTRETIVMGLALARCPMIATAAYPLRGAGPRDPAPPLPSSDPDDMPAPEPAAGPDDVDDGGEAAGEDEVRAGPDDLGSAADYEPG
jgi:hypothetical protein